MTMRMSASCRRTSMEPMSLTPNCIGSESDLLVFGSFAHNPRSGLIPVLAFGMTFRDVFRKCLLQSIPMVLTRTVWYLDHLTAIGAHRPNRERRNINAFDLHLDSITQTDCQRRGAAHSNCTTTIFSRWTGCKGGLCNYEQTEVL